jgi:hypothetical protein
MVKGSSGNRTQFSPLGRCTPFHLNNDEQTKSCIPPLCYFLHKVTRWSRTAIEKLTVSQPIQKFFACLRFIAVFTRVRHLSLSRARLLQFMASKHTSSRSSLIVSFHLLLGLFQVISYLHASPPKSCVHFSSPPYALLALPISSSFMWSP